MHPGNRLPAGGGQMKNVDDVLGHRADGRPGIQQGSKYFPLSLLIGLQPRLGYPAPPVTAILPDSALNPA